MWMRKLLHVFIMAVTVTLPQKRVHLDRLVVTIAFSTFSYHSQQTC